MRGLTLIAALAVATVAGIQPAAADDDADRPRGDMPPATADLDQLLALGLSSSESRAAFEQLRALLLERVGGDRVAEADLLMGAMQGMIEVANRRLALDASPRQATLPPAGMLMPVNDAERLSAGLSGQMTGVGIEFQLHSNPGILIVSRILPGSPAERAQLVVGDQVLGIDSQPLLGQPLRQVLGLLRGEPGSRIRLDVLRGDQLGASQFAVELERTAFEVRSVAEAMHRNGVGYAQVFQLHQGTAVELADSLTRLQELGATSFVLDLRNTPGGDIAAVAEIADLFLPESTVVLRLVEPGVGEQDLIAKGPATFRQDLVVLVNGWTYGAAEALAASLKEHGRAYLIGEPTLGTARTQTLLSLGPKLRLRLDSVRLETALGRSWQGEGVLPDLPLWPGAESPSVAVGPLDPQFQHAVHYLEEQAAAPR